MELIMMDQNGWSKSLKVEKTLTRIGAAGSNDIQLKSKGIAPVHLQIINSPDLPSKCQLINLAAEIMVHTDEGVYQLPRLSTIEIRNGDEIELGDYRIELKIPLGAEYLQRSSAIDAVLSFPDAVIRPDFLTTGQLTITNVGSQSDCQFKVTLSGLPDDCYQIDPIPLMYPDAQEDVRVQLFHRRHYPPVGFHDLIFSITAPGHYPGEAMIIKQGVYVVPVFDQGFELVDDTVVSTNPRDELTIPESPGSSQASAEYELEDPADFPDAPGPEPILIKSTSEVGDVASADLQAKKNISDDALEIGELPKVGLLTTDNEPKVSDQSAQSQPEFVSEADLADSSSKPLSTRDQHGADEPASLASSEDINQKPKNVKILSKQHDEFWEEE